MYLKFLKEDNNEEYSDYDLANIAESLKTNGEISIKCSVTKTCKNLGLYLTSTSSLGRYKFQPDVSDSSARGLLFFNSTEEPESGLSISSSWYEDDNGNSILKERENVFFSIDDGSDYSNRIIIGPELLTMEEGFAINIKLSFKPSLRILKDKRIFVGLEAAANDS